MEFTVLGGKGAAFAPNLLSAASHTLSRELRVIRIGTSVFDEKHGDDLLGFLSSESVVTLPRNLEKDQVLSYMVQELAAKGLLPTHLVPRITSDLIRREQSGTTGLGNGLALPHLKRPELTAFMGLIGVATEGIDFNSLDGRPVRIVILILSPSNQTNLHLEILGRIAKLCSDRTLQYSTQLARSPDLLLRFLGIGTKGVDRDE